MINKVSLLLIILITISLNGCFGLLDIAEDVSLKKNQAEAEKYVREHPELKENIKKLILDNRIDVGMTKEQVELATYYSWRNHHIEPTSKYGADEVWIYKRTYVASDVIKYEYLYFKGDTLIKIEKVDGRDKWVSKKEKRREKREKQGEKQDGINGSE